MLNSLYPHSCQLVKCLVSHFLPTNSGSRERVKNQLQYQLLLNEFISKMYLQIKNPSNKALASIIYVYLEDKYPNLSKKSQNAIITLLYFYDCSKEFHISNQELATLLSCGLSRVKEITTELCAYHIISKSLRPFDDGFRVNGNALHITLKLVDISIVKFKSTNFFGVYLGTKTTIIDGIEYKHALFNQVHDIDKIIFFKNYRVNYDEENSDFLDDLRKDDTILFTPQIFTPSIKGCKKHPLNLRIFKKSQEDNLWLDNLTNIREACI